MVIPDRQLTPLEIFNLKIYLGRATLGQERFTEVLQEQMPKSNQ